MHTSLHRIFKDTVEDEECCVDTVFNALFSLLVLGYDI